MKAYADSVAFVASLIVMHVLARTLHALSRRQDREEIMLALCNLALAKNDIVGTDKIRMFRVQDNVTTDTHETEGNKLLIERNRAAILERLERASFVHGAMLQLDPLQAPMRCSALRTETDGVLLVCIMRE